MKYNHYQRWLPNIVIKAKPDPVRHIALFDPEHDSSYMENADAFRAAIHRNAEKFRDTQK